MLLILLLSCSFRSADTVRYTSIIGEACILTSWIFRRQTRAQRRHTMDHVCGEDNVMNKAEGGRTNNSDRRGEEVQQQNNNSAVQSIYIIVKHYSIRIEPRALEL